MQGHLHPDKDKKVCEFEIARGTKMGRCGKVAVASIDDRYFCAECVVDVLDRFECTLVEDRTMSIITTQQFIDKCRVLQEQKNANYHP